jgi:serine/threonine protein kinase
MDIAEERRAIAFFEQAQDWPPESREARLEELLRGEPRLLQTVRAMLRADASLIPTIPPEPRQWVEEKAPERLAAYRVQGELGRGGMGIVYRAARDDGLYEREVAIKLLRRGLFSAAAGENFASERRILGRLRHPHIAQILDAGMAEDGRAYIVMELIEGSPIHVAAEAGGLDLRARMLAFREACEAVDFAHRNFVAHGDIKPSNVVLADGFGVKLLDFGISGIFEPGAPERRVSGGHGPYTPGFASPERQSGGTPSVADDVFALGVLMKVLLEGSAGERDLAAVAAKAVEPEAELRYATARELIEEIDHWLRHQPVKAGATKAHRLALYWRRHRLGLSIAGAAAASLVAVAILTSTLYFRADAARVAAEHRFQETRSLARYMLDDVTAELQSLPASSPIRQGIAQRAQVALARLRETGGAADPIALDDAEAYARVGQILSGMDVSDPASARAASVALARAELELRRLAPGLVERPAARLALADTLVNRAQLAIAASHRPEISLAKLDEADRLLDPLIASQPRWRAARMTRFSSDLVRGQVFDYEGKFAPLGRLVAAAFVRARAIPPASGGQAVEWLLKVEQLHSLAGDALYYSGNIEGALAQYRQAAFTLQRSRTIRTDVRAVIREAFVGFNIASTLAEHGRPREALEWIERGVAAAARLRTFEDSPRARHIQNIVTMERAVELKALGRLDEAIREARASIEGRKERVRLQPGNYEARRAVPVGLRPLAELYQAAGRKEEACATLAEADRAWLAIDRDGGITQFDKGADLVLLAKLHRDWQCGRPD